MLAPSLERVQGAPLGLPWGGGGRSELDGAADADAGALDRLEGFASRHGAAFYGLPPHDDTVTLVRESWTVPAEYAFGRETIVPLRAGETLRWRVAGNSPPRGVS